MKLDTIIRILDNKEYKKITKGRMYIFEWFDMELYNGDMIRIEQITLFGEIADKYRMSYFVYELDDAIKIWEGKYGTNTYYILSNLFNSVKQEEFSLNTTEKYKGERSE